MKSEESVSIQRRKWEYRILLILIKKKLLFWLKLFSSNSKRIPVEIWDSENNIHLWISPPVYIKSGETVRGMFGYVRHTKGRVEEGGRQWRRVGKHGGGRERVEEDGREWEGVGGWIKGLTATTNETFRYKTLASPWCPPKIWTLYLWWFPRYDPLNKQGSDFFL